MSILSTCDAYDHIRHELLTDSGLNLYTIREQAEALERENADLRADLALTRKRVKELDVALLEADEQVRDLTRRGKAPPGRAGRRPRCAHAHASAASDHSSSGASSRPPLVQACGRCAGCGCD